MTTGNPPPPPHLAVVQELLNTRDIRRARDELDITPQMRRWLVRHRLAAPQTEAAGAAVAAAS